MKGKMLDLYERWEQNKELADKLKTIQDLVSKRVPQKQIAEVIGISERTLIKLKKVHPKLQRAFVYGNEVMKNSLIDALYKKAVGYDHEDQQSIIEETKTGVKKRIVKTKKHYPSETNAAKYLLQLHFGVEFHERRYEIEMMQKRIDKDEEVWINEHSDEEAIGALRVRKQSKVQ